MRRRKFTTLLLAFCTVFALSVALPSCGTLHSHWGVEHEYDFSDNGPHRPKPKKHKKQKKHKPKKHNKKHHDDD